MKNTNECDVDLAEDNEDRSITRTTAFMTLKTGEIETDYVRHNGISIDNMDFNNLIKKNPFEQDIKLFERFVQQKKPDPVPERESRLSKEKKEKASRLQEVQSSDGFVRPSSTLGGAKQGGQVSKLNKANKEMRRAISLHSSDSSKPLRGILKVGARSRFAKEFHSIEPGNSEAFSEKRSTGRAGSASKRGFIQSNSFDAHDAETPKAKGKVSGFKKAPPTKKK